MPQRDRGAVLVRLLVALVVIAGAYLGMAWFLGRHVPSNTSVAGVPIGGMSPADAQATLKRALGESASRPVRVLAGGETVEVDPSAAGLSLDLDATLQGLSGFSAKPADVWNHLTGGQEEPLRTTVDRSRLESALTAVASRVDKTPVEGSVTFPGGRTTVVTPVVGRRLDVARSADSVVRAWPATKPVAATVETVPPAVPAAEVARVAKEFATPAMSGPVKVSAGGRTFALAPATYAPALSVAASSSGTLTPVVDDAVVLRVVRAAAVRAGVEKEARDARIVLAGSRAQVVPSVTGVSIDPASLKASFLPALTSASRTAVVRTTVTQPQLSTAQATKVAPKEVIGTFTTYLPFNPPRTENITIAARTLNGTYIAPGKQFSLNAVLGPRTAGKGYNEAPVIMNGRLTKDYGGGISQLSTTTFNAAFFAGVRIEEYHPHSFYISRYPEGREATISWPDVDQKWTNDTGNGILVQAGVSGNAVTVTLHGTKVWDVEAVKGPRRNVVQPKRIVDDRASCVAQTPTPGFDVTVTRIFTRNGAEVKRSTFSTHYIPEDDVVCTHPQAS